MRHPDLRIGSEVFLRKEYPVDAEVPEKYVYANRPFSEKLTTARIHLGRLYTTDEIVKRNIREEANHIANDIWRSFMSYYYDVTFSECKQFVESKIDVNKKLEVTEFIMPEGHFIVTNTIFHPAAYSHLDFRQEYYEYEAVRKNGDDKIRFQARDYFEGGWQTAQVITF